MHAAPAVSRLVGCSPCCQQLTTHMHLQAVHRLLLRIKLQWATSHPAEGTGIADAMLQQH